MGDGGVDDGGRTVGGGRWTLGVGELINYPPPFTDHRSPPVAHRPSPIAHPLGPNVQGVPSVFSYGVGGCPCELAACMPICIQHLSETRSMRRTRHALMMILSGVSVACTA